MGTGGGRDHERESQGTCLFLKYASYQFLLVMFGGRGRIRGRTRKGYHCLYKGNGGL